MLSDYNKSKPTNIIFLEEILSMLKKNYNENSNNVSYAFEGSEKYYNFVVKDRGVNVFLNFFFYDK